MLTLNPAISRPQFQHSVQQHKQDGHCKDHTLVYHLATNPADYAGLARVRVHVTRKRSSSSAVPKSDPGWAMQHSVVHLQAAEKLI